MDEGFLDAGLVQDVRMISLLHRVYARALDR